MQVYCLFPLLLTSLHSEHKRNLDVTFRVWCRFSCLVSFFVFDVTFCVWCHFSGLMSLFAFDVAFRIWCHFMWCRFFSVEISLRIIVDTANMTTWNILHTFWFFFIPSYAAGGLNFWFPSVHNPDRLPATTCNLANYVSYYFLSAVLRLQPTKSPMSITIKCYV